MTSELWILETAVDGAVPLDQIFAQPSYMEFQFNKPPHGLKPRELIVLLEGLVENGLINIGVNRGSECWSAETLLHHWRWRTLSTAGVCYWLTDKGGSYWEELARPNWNRFRKLTMSATHIVIEAWEQDVVDRAVDLAVHDPLHGFQFETHSTQQWRVVPWFATYWKVFSSGCRVEAKYFMEYDAENKWSLARARREREYFEGWV